MGSPEELVKEINKTLGTEVVRLGSDPGLVVTYIPTGILPIDYLLGGGIPRGRVTEIFGAFSTLKSYIGLRTIAQVQQREEIAALVDTERAFDPDWASDLGVDVDNLIYQNPETGEEAVDITEALLRAKASLIVWDSVAATLPAAEHEKRMHGEKHQPARQAALMSRAMRKLTAANSKTAMVFINQTREKVGVMYGSPETTPGGRSLPFYASYRLAIRRAGSIKQDSKVWDGDKNVTTKETVALKFRASLEKSKLSSPFRDVIFTFDLETAEIDEVGWIVSWGLRSGAITKSGRRWTLGDKSFGSKSDLYDHLDSDDESWEALREAMYQEIN